MASGEYHREVLPKDTAMKRYRLIVLFAASLTCWCQQVHPKYVIGIDIIGPNSSCPSGPVFIGAVRKISPAAKAGIRLGDQLITINGTPVKDLQDAAHRISSDSPQPVSVELKRRGLVRKLTIQRERSDIVWSQNGSRLLDDGFIVGSDYSEAEIQEVRKLDGDVMSAMRNGDFLNVFPGHYPADKNLYYPGFEIFVWDKGEQVRVGGIEDGPARTSGVRWGDEILTVNGVDPRKKSLAELEALFSSQTPAKMTLQIERVRTQKTFTLTLDLASSVLRDNNWQIVDGHMVPLWVPTPYVSCFQLTH